MQAWQGAHRHELERRRNQERYRGLLRTVVRAWREEADGREAKTLRSVALRPGVVTPCPGLQSWYSPPSRSLTAAELQHRQLPALATRDHPSQTQRTGVRHQAP